MADLSEDRFHIKQHLHELEEVEGRTWAGHAIALGVTLVVAIVLYGLFFK